MKKQIILAAILSASAFAQNNEANSIDTTGEVLTITTSKPHIQPQLMTLQTAQVLESYGLGFSGSGNIHKSLANWTKNPLRGSLILGLGDVAELGYGMQELLTTEMGTQRLTRGHIKIQAFKDPDGILPNVAVSFGQNLQTGFADTSNTSYELERQEFEVLSSWSAGSENKNFSVHPGVRIIQDELTHVAGAKQSDRSVMNIQPQIGLTWQTQKNIVYMFESRYNRALKNGSIGASHKPTYEGVIENNFGARFLFRNWLFMDAGIRTAYTTEKENFQPEIHANFTGVIPLKSIFSRSKNLN